MKIDPSQFSEAGGIRCDAVLEKLDDFVDGGLDEETRSKIEKHLGECANCEAFGNSYAKMLQALSSLD